MGVVDFDEMASSVAAELRGIQACLFVSRDGLTLGAYPPSGENARARLAWDRLVEAGDPERGFLVVDDEIWVLTRRGGYTGVVIAGARVPAGHILDRLDDVLGAIDGAGAQEEVPLEAGTPRAENAPLAEEPPTPPGDTPPATPSPGEEALAERARPAPADELVEGPATDEPAGAHGTRLFHAPPQPRDANSPAAPNAGEPGGAGGENASTARAPLGPGDESLDVGPLRDAHIESLEANPLVPEPAPTEPPSDPTDVQMNGSGRWEEPVEPVAERSVTAALPEPSDNEGDELDLMIAELAPEGWPSDPTDVEMNGGRDAERPAAPTADESVEPVDAEWSASSDQSSAEGVAEQVDEDVDRVDLATELTRLWRQQDRSTER